jgi:hypothetical protein
MREPGCDDDIDEYRTVGDLLAEDKERRTLGLPPAVGDPDTVPGPVRLTTTGRAAFTRDELLAIVERAGRTVATLIEQAEGRCDLDALLLYREHRNHLRRIYARAKRGNP